jgi:hypothetical protein
MVHSVRDTDGDTIVLVEPVADTSNGRKSSLTGICREVVVVRQRADAKEGTDDGDGFVEGLLEGDVLFDVDHCTK